MGPLEGRGQGVRETGLPTLDSRPPLGPGKGSIIDLPLQLDCRLSSPDNNVDCRMGPQGQAQLLGRLMPCINI